MSNENVLKDIFGSVEDGGKGLVDSGNSVEFDERLQVLKAVCNPEFWDYLVTYVADDMKEVMAPEIRRIIGLKDDFYYDNALECQNFRYKQKIEEAKKEKEPGVKTSECSWVEAIEIYQTMLQEARNNIQRAVIGKGPFQLAQEFSHLDCSEQQWMEMTPDERRKHLAKFDPFVGIDKLCKSDAILPMPSIGNSSQSFSSKSHETIETFFSEDDESFKWEDVPDLKTSASEVKVVTSSEARGSSQRLVLPGVTSTCTSSTITSPGSSMDATNESSLGESACARNIGQFQDSGLPEYLKGSWINTQKIDKNGVGNFPGSESKRVVISLSQGDVCHTVTISHSRQVQCDKKCPKYKLHKLCAHTIAVAYKCGPLCDVCRSYKQSVSSMVQSLISPDVGK